MAIFLSRRRPLSKKTVSILIFFSIFSFCSSILRVLLLLDNFGIIRLTRNSINMYHMRQHNQPLLVLCFFSCNTSSPKRPRASYIASGRCLISASGQPLFRKRFSVLFPRVVDSFNSLGLLARLLDSNDVEKRQGTYMPVSFLHLRYLRPRNNNSQKRQKNRVLTAYDSKFDFCSDSVATQNQPYWRHLAVDKIPVL